MAVQVLLTFVILVCCDAFLKVSCGNAFGSPFSSPRAPLLSRSCGKLEAPKLNQFSIKEEKVLPLSEPWLSSMRETQDHKTHYGVAVLVQPRDDVQRTDIALTSALNCKSFAPGHVILIGSSYTRTKQPGGIILPIVGCYPHKDAFGYEHDIAVVKFSQSVEFGENVKPICLPSSGDDMRLGDDGTVSGWGIAREHSASINPRQVWLRVVNSSICEGFYRTNENTACVQRLGSQGRAFYRGDYGSPFTSQIDGHYVALGLATEAPVKIKKYPKMDANIPADIGLVTRLAPYVENGWIEEMMKRHSSLWQSSS